MRMASPGALRSGSALLRRPQAQRLRVQRGDQQHAAGAQPSSGSGCLERPSDRDMYMSYRSDMPYDDPYAYIICTWNAAVAYDHRALDAFDDLAYTSLK